MGERWLETNIEWRFALLTFAQLIVAYRSRKAWEKGYNTCQRIMEMMEQNPQWRDSPLHPDRWIDQLFSFAVECTDAEIGKAVFVMGDRLFRETQQRYGSKSGYEAAVKWGGEEKQRDYSLSWDDSQKQWQQRLFVIHDQ